MQRIVIPVGIPGGTPNRTSEVGSQSGDSRSSSSRPTFTSPWSVVLVAYFFARTYRNVRAKMRALASLAGVIA